MKTIFSPQLIEIINGTLFALHIILGILFFHYSLRRIRSIGWSCAGYRGAEGAIAILIFIVGSGVTRGGFWLMRHLQNHGYSTTGIKSYVIAVAIAGGLVAIAGGLCMMRVFAPVRYGPWPFIFTAAACLSFGIVLAL